MLRVGLVVLSVLLRGFSRIGARAAHGEIAIAEKRMQLIARSVCLQQPSELDDIQIVQSVAQKSPISLRNNKQKRAQRHTRRPADNELARMCGSGEQSCGQRARHDEVKKGLLCQLFGGTPKIAGTTWVLIEGWSTW